jgi:hypothetical protein
VSVVAVLIVLAVFATGCSKAAETTTSSIVFLTAEQVEQADENAPSVATTETAPEGQGAEETTATADSGSFLGDQKTVELVGVGMSAEGLMITVQFKTEPNIARRWRQGNVYVVDEATGRRYDQIPVMPVIGPLFGHPVRPDQIGYVMFNNVAPGLKTGDKVTVVLGGFKEEHVAVP